MILLNTIKRHYRLNPEMYPILLKTVEDNLISAPYSIHNLIQLGDSHKSPGQWFSPAEVSFGLLKLLQISPCSNFKISVCMDSIIFCDEIYAIACNSNAENLKSVCNCFCMRENCEDCESLSAFK